MTRKSRIAVGVVVALLLTVQSVYAQKELRKIRLNVFRVDAATVAAKVNGYFAAEGLEVDVTPTPNSTDQMRGLSQGKFDIVSTAFDNVLAWSGKEDAEIVAIAQISDKTVLPVFVRPEIQNWSDLRGKSSPPTRWIQLSLWCSDASYWPMAWIWRKVIMSWSPLAPPAPVSSR